MATAIGGPRILLRQLRETMAEPLASQDRLDKIVNLIAVNMQADVCSFYVLRDDGALELQLRMPEQLGGPGGGTNPEQLFAAGYAACFHGALSLLAARAGVAIPDAEVTAQVSFGRDPVDGLFMLTATIHIRLSGVDRAVAEELVRNTERVCPYAKMARAGIDCVVSLAS